MYQVPYNTSFHLILKKKKKEGIEAALGSQGRLFKEVASQPSQGFQIEGTWVPVRLR